MKSFLNFLLMITINCFVASYLEAGETHKVADGVYFHESDGGSNIGWVIFEEYVFVIDANFPNYAETVLAEIKETTDKPIRFVFDTHHHGDHAFGNNIFVKAGATPVSQVNCFDVLVDSKSMYANWAQGKPAYQNTKLEIPTITFEDKMVFDDGNQRVELLYFGHGHTVGDAVAYLPKQKILFTGDLCVNGAYNYMGQSNSESWVRALTRVKGLDVETVCPGHGEMAGSELLDTQLEYFVKLREQVAASLQEGKTAEETMLAIDIPMYKEWTGVEPRKDHITYVYSEMAGLITPWEFQKMGLWEGPNPTKDSPGWEQPKKLLARGLSTDEVKELKAVAPQMEIVNAENRENYLEALTDADALFSRISKEELDQAKKLKWVHSQSAGVSSYMYPEFIGSDVVLTNGQAMYGPAIADHVMGMALMFSKGLAKQYEQQINEKEWKWVSQGEMQDIEGKTMLILGYGGIGSRVAKRAAGFGMDIYGIDPQDLDKPHYVIRIGKPDELHTLLPKADFVVSTVPLTKHTHRYFGAKEFDLMKDTAYFINVGRGQTVVQEDMIAALKNGKIAGAGLDVTDPEPLPEGHELWELDNVIITPHMSGRTGESWDRRWSLFKENVRRFANGELLFNVVNKQVGY